MTKYEDGASEPWSPDKPDDQFIEGLLDSIVGFEIEITRIEGKWKLSQNRPARDRQGVIEGLANEGEQASSDMAALVHAAQIVDAGNRK